jgi:hypothetical protein
VKTEIYYRDLSYVRIPPQTPNAVLVYVPYQLTKEILNEAWADVLTEDALGNKASIFKESEKSQASMSEEEIQR